MSLVMAIVKVRCGIARCAWAVPLPGWLGPELMARGFDVWWGHLVAAHGLNPDKTAVPGLVGPTNLYFDHVGGAVTTLTIREKDPMIVIEVVARHPIDELIAKAGAEAAARGAGGYVILCERCGFPVYDHAEGRCLDVDEIERTIGQDRRRRALRL